MARGRLFKIFGRMLTDKKFRNTVLKRLTEETKKATKPINVDTKLLDEDQEFLKSLKIGFVGGCELSFIKEFLEANGAKCYHTFDNNESSDSYLALSDNKGGIFSFEPDFVIISDVQNIRNYIAEIQSNKATFDLQEQHFEEIKKRLEAALNEARKKLNANYILIDYPLVPRPAHGRFDYKHLDNALSIREFLNRLNLLLFQLGKENEDTYTLTINEAFLKAGVGYQIREGDADGIYEHFTREGAVTVGLDLVEELKIIKGKGKRIKCVVTDLDNTLWDGILRDDGVEGVNLHINRLHILEMLSKRGIIVALASKNDPSSIPIIDEVLGKFSDLFVLKKINWNDKAQSLQEIAHELNIGIDSLAFFDDNPYERDQIKSFLPMVSVYPDFEILQSLTSLEFEPIGKLTAESRKRAEMYAQQMKREQAEKQFGVDKTSFLNACGMELWMREAENRDLGRVTELIQRTNQLNATAVRYSKEEILEFHKSKDYRIFVVNLYDRYGEYGLIGAALVHLLPEHWDMELATFSCRAMGKTVEESFLYYIMREAQKEKATLLTGKYRQTEKNEAVKRIFEDAGFEQTSKKEGDFIIWEYNFKERSIPKYAEWFKILKKGRE
ncbi:MAG: HAD-IIIC family phosphatase [Candidatus Heimdallarchaeota archaeon]|nr:HAD-IIIC family phosphatase [Candidatus Heimdallarchaeota archaeon]